MFDRLRDFCGSLPGGHRSTKQLAPGRACGCAIAKCPFGPVSRSIGTYSREVRQGHEDKEQR